MNDIKIRSYQYSIHIIQLLKRLPKTYEAQTLGKQLLRSATSIGANIVEAQGGSSKKDFINFYQIAFKSANESIYWLELFRDGQLASPLIINPLIQETVVLSKILGASLLTLKGKRK